MNKAYDSTSRPAFQKVLPTALGFALQRPTASQFLTEAAPSYREQFEPESKSEI